MRQIDKVHDPEHQRQPGGEQEQQQTELQAVQTLFEEEEHGFFYEADFIIAGCIHPCAVSLAGTSRTKRNALAPARAARPAPTSAATWALTRSSTGDP